MCFGDIIEATAALDADVISAAAARSRMEILTDLAAAGFGRGSGPVSARVSGISTLPGCRPWPR
jgi:5-methyltetrahydropteroyltriglutamate--homocysteine methyltransferase